MAGPPTYEDAAELRLCVVVAHKSALRPQELAWMLSDKDLATISVRQQHIGICKYWTRIILTASNRCDHRKCCYNRKKCDYL